MNPYMFVGKDDTNEILYPYSINKSINEFIFRPIRIPPQIHILEPTRNFISKVFIPPLNPPDLPGLDYFIYKGKNSGIFELKYSISFRFLNLMSDIKFKTSIYTGKMLSISQYSL